MVKLFLRRRKFVKKPLETTSQILSLQRASVPSSKVSDPGLQPGTKLKEMHAEENIVTRNQGDISSKSSSSSPWDTCTSCFSTLDFDESNSSTTGTCQDTNLQNLEFGNDMVWKSSYKLKMLQINPRPDILKVI
ncbi:unnamed protein product [Allacma fusca]|uniref:Uncharacterized protein n=1 Tax=Allacma fusca TaxID=39272 RepID=A0A8J2KMM3_9HEXA|nr:unnamed protein product [Allacma fusca]